MFVLPVKNACKGQAGFEMKHLDLEAITAENNPYCFKNERGKINIKIEGFYGKLVKIS